MILIHLVILLGVLLLLRWALQGFAAATGAPPVIAAVIDILLVLVFVIMILNYTVGLAGLSPLRLR